MKIMYFILFLLSVMPASNWAMNGKGAKPGPLTKFTRRRDPRRGRNMVAPDSNGCKQPPAGLVESDEPDEKFEVDQFGKCMFCCTASWGWVLIAAIILWNITPSPASQKYIG